MTIRTILLHPDPRLKKRCDPVVSFDSGLTRLYEDMLETMYEAPGVGLAAPQIGLGIRFLVMDCAKGEEPPRPIAMANPEILWSSEELNVHEEGCLSIPDEYADVTRPARVRVRWFDVTGEAQEDEFDGLDATCVQHEIDHLNGVLFTDHLGPMKRRLITERARRRKRQQVRKTA